MGIKLNKWYSYVDVEGKTRLARLTQEKDNLLVELGRHPTKNTGSYYMRINKQYVMQHGLIDSLIGWCDMDFIDYHTTEEARHTDCTVFNPEHWKLLNKETK